MKSRHFLGRWLSFVIILSNSPFALLTLIAFQLPTDIRFVHSNQISNLRLLMTLFPQRINLVSLYLGKLCVGSHNCSFDLAVRESLILPQLASLSAIEDALGR